MYFTIGLPASGKSTAARRMAAESNGTILEVTKDDLRIHPDAPKDRRRQERWVLARRDRIVAEALSAGLSIVVHDTNFNPVHRRTLEAAAADHGADFVVLDFTDVDVDECIRRDSLREHPVGASVILGMWRQYLA